ncbi:hypothetical protein GGE67_006370 [Rhizobium leucaenae]|nr:hypothetical protein [Rhizobium leucaenae]
MSALAEQLRVAQTYLLLVDLTFDTLFNEHGKFAVVYRSCTSARVQSTFCNLAIAGTACCRSPDRTNTASH